MSFIVAVVVAVIVALLERGRAPTESRPITSALASRWAPFAVAAVWAAVAWWSWGAWQPTPVVHDEFAYLFQARLFAEGRWAAPSPPIPDLFAQPHLLVSPVMAAKYPPGHSLLLALGALFGAPVIIVVLLAALRAAMVFVLARRLADGWVALVTCLFMLHGDSLQFGVSYFSQATTGALVLVAWYALLRWRDGDGQRWIVLLALALGWCAITRPYTAVFVALPIGFVVLREVLREQNWRDLGLAVAVGAVIVAILPLWSARTTGDWRLWPTALYARDYLPFDYPHFGVDPSEPRRALPTDIAALVPSLRKAERAHTVANVPRIAWARFGEFTRTTWYAPLPELMLALIGLVGVAASAWLGIATGVTLFVGYLAHPTWAQSTIYNFETQPVLVFLTVCGLAAVLRGLSGSPGERTILRAAPRGSRALVVLAVLSLVFVQHDVRTARRWQTARREYQDRFRATLSQVPPGPAVVFVRHASWHPAHFSLITNGPDWQNAPVWVVPDQGDERRSSLRRLAPNRRAFLYDEQTARLDPYDTLETSSRMVIHRGLLVSR